MAENADDLKDLAQRLLALPHPLGAVTVALYPGRLPDDRDIEVVVPAGGRFIGSAVYRRNGERTMVDAIIDLDLPPPEVVASYEADLNRRGWLIRAEHWGGGGFVTTGMGFGRWYQRTESGPLLMVEARDRAQKKTELRLRLDSDRARAAPPRHHRPEIMEALPSLYPPPGVEVQGGGSGGSESSWASHAQAMTAMAPRELEPYFANQLTTAGWKRLARGDSDASAWSGWTVPSKKGWHGLLIVMATDADQRMLVLQLQGPPRRQSGAWSQAISGLIRR